MRGCIALLICLLLAFHFGTGPLTAVQADDDDRHVIFTDTLQDPASECSVPSTDDTDPAAKHLPTSCHDHCSKIVGCAADPHNRSPDQHHLAYGAAGIVAAGVSILLPPPR